jgi:hypothetical protein
MKVVKDDKWLNATDNISIDPEFNGGKACIGTTLVKDTDGNQFRISLNEFYQRNGIDVWSVNYGKIQSENRKIQNSKIQKERIDKGTHNFLGNSLQKQLLAEGRHASQHPERNKKISVQLKKRISEGNTHIFKEVARQLETSTHPTQKLRTCPHCGKNGKSMVMLRWHFDKCKFIAS